MDPITLIPVALSLLEKLVAKAQKGEKVSREEWLAELKAGETSFDDLGEES